MADSVWENLPAHLLDSILSMLESCVDYLHFSLVCGLWRSNAVDSFDKRKLSNCLTPLLLLPGINEKDGTWGLYSILDEKFLGTKLQLPEDGTQLRGSSEGWLATIDRNLAVTLYNPFVTKKDSVIHLPPLPTSPPLWQIKSNICSFFNKILTCTPNPLEDPTDLTCVLLVGDVCDSDIVYIQPRKDTEWKIIFSINRILQDAVHYNNRFYCLTKPAYPFYLNNVDQFDAFYDDDDFFRSQIKLIKSEVPGVVVDPLLDSCVRYLVNSVDGGELLQVLKIHLNCYNLWDLKNLSFEVFKFCFETSSWIEMDSLGDSTLFLGDSGSIRVSASRLSKCKPNHIYFICNQFEEDDLEFGEYDFETGSITSLGTIVPQVMGLQSPLWVSPTLRF